MTEFTVEELIARGYRKVSNKYGRLSRIDRPDWLHLLAVHLGRAPADFYVPGAEKPAGNWCDYYRRVLSKDKVDIDPQLARKAPSSDWDDIGYVELEAAEGNLLPGLS